jgi:dTDP-4-dehydrorhamnose reductase
VPVVPVELTDRAALEGALDAADPEVVVHCAALSAVDAVWRDPVRGRAVNVEATARIAAWCGQRDRRLISTSTDLVFAGTRSWYREDDPAEPILEYGRTKLEAESLVLAIPRGLVTRLCLLYGPSRSGRDTYIDRTLALLGRGEPQSFFTDEYRTPLDFATASRILAALVRAETTGLLHVAGRERVSRFELVRRVVVALGLDPQLVRGTRQADAALAEPRPADVSLDTSRLAALFPDLHRPSIEEAVATFERR